MRRKLPEFNLIIRRQWGPFKGVKVLLLFHRRVVHRILSKLQCSNSSVQASGATFSWTIRMTPYISYNSPYHRQRYSMLQIFLKTFPLKTHHRRSFSFVLLKLFTFNPSVAYCAQSSNSWQERCCVGFHGWHCSLEKPKIDESGRDTKDWWGK